MNLKPLKTIFQDDPEILALLKVREDSNTLAVLESKLNEYIKERVDSLILPQGDKGDTPIAGIDFPLPKDGENYILSEDDKKEIADMVEVPVVEKVVEKTKIIEQPIVTNEIKEVALHETPEETALKLNTLKDAIDVSVVKDAVAKKDLDKITSGMKEVDGRIKLIDQRWHGAGLSKVTTDNTLTGLGTPASPLHAIPSTISTGGTISGGTDNSVLYINPANVLDQDPTHFSYEKTTSTLQVGGVASRVQGSEALQLNSNNGNSDFTIFNAGAGTFAAHGFAIADGTISAPTIVTSFTENVGAQFYMAYGGASFITGAELRVTLDGTVTASNAPMAFNFNTRNAGGTLATRMTIRANGNVGIGITPTERLHVSGNGIITGTLSVTGNVGIGVLADSFSRLNINNKILFGDISGFGFVDFFGSSGETLEINGDPAGGSSYNDGANTLWTLYNTGKKLAMWDSTNTVNVNIETTDGGFNFTNDAGGNADIGAARGSFSNLADSTVVTITGISGGTSDILQILSGATLKYEFSPSTLTLADAVNIGIGTSTGTKIGGASSKIGFFNATPVQRQSSTTDLRVALINLGLYGSGGMTPLDLNGGDFYTTGALGAARAQFYSTNTGYVPLALKGANGQTANYIDIDTFGGSNVFEMTSTGNIGVGVAADSLIKFYVYNPVSTATGDYAVSENISFFSPGASSSGCTPLKNILQLGLSGTNTAAQHQVMRNHALITSGSGAISNIFYCLYNLFQYGGGSTTFNDVIGNGTDLVIYAGSGNITSLYGFKLSTNFITGAGNYTGTITNFYGVYLPDITVATNKWAIYSLGGPSSHLGGFSFGMNTVPTALVDIAAGSTTVGPLHLTSGTLKTTPVAGDVEFLTDAYYGTITTGTKRSVFSLNQTGRTVGATAAVASVLAYTLPAVDASFQISMNVLVTTSTLHTFTCECAYTDEGNTARVLTLQFSSLAGTFVTAITNAAGAVPYEGVPLNIRCKASTTITLRTQAAGTYTTVTFNIEGFITQIS